MRSGAQKEIIFGRYEYIAAEFEKTVQAAIDGEFSMFDVKPLQGKVDE